MTTSSIWELDDEADSCSQSRLKPGARVREAQLELGPDGPVFVEIDLLR